ncbi:MAG TPA: hypothetical protein ENI87_06855, partial [bacterium]|nr:hypothetical protein [bacterium]
MKTPFLLTFAVPLALLGSCKFLFRQLIDYTELWPNGLPKSRGKLMGDKQTGEWILSYESGRPLARGAYKDDRQYGPWTFYYENGNEMRSGSYDERGLRTGLWIYKYEDQLPQARGSYVADFEDGPWTFYGPDGAVRMAGQYDAGKQSGLWHFYYAGGRPKAEGLYYRGDRVGVWQVWSRDGSSRLQDYGSKPGVQPVREVWPDSDRVRRVGLRVNGTPAGRWASYHENARLRFYCGLRNGMPNGVFEARDRNGTVLAQGRFENGALAPGGIAVVDGVTRELVPGALPAVPQQVAPWSELAALVAVGPEAMLAVLVDEVKAEIEGQAFV